MSDKKKPNTDLSPEDARTKFDDVLKRMLNTPPQPHIKPKPKQSKKKAR